MGFFKNPVVAIVMAIIAVVGGLGVVISYALSVA